MSIDFLSENTIIFIERYEMNIEKIIAKQIKLEKYKEDMKGEGMYIFENNTKGDLFLPRPTQSGQRLVPKGRQFQGDSYYFSMLKTNEIKLIKELAPQHSQLLTEQPPTVTDEGQVEYVVQPKETKINEQQNDAQEDVLLCESPVDGIKILR